MLEFRVLGSLSNHYCAVLYALHNNFKKVGALVKKNNNKKKTPALPLEERGFLRFAIALATKIMVNAIEAYSSFDKHSVIIPTFSNNPLAKRIDLLKYFVLYIRKRKIVK